MYCSMRSVNYLGHIIGEGATDPEKISAMADFTLPKVPRNGRDVPKVYKQFSFGSCSINRFAQDLEKVPDDPTSFKCG